MKAGLIGSTLKQISTRERGTILHTITRPRDVERFHSSIIHVTMPYVMSVVALSNEDHSVCDAKILFFPSIPHMHSYIPSGK